MDRLQIIENEIIKLSTLINVKYPELYKYLDETPMAIPFEKKPHINDKIMSDYLESLKLLLKHHIEKHKS